jgi:branched-subunit amino acid aminotransferase/4-amino-4-deoxychorismate lyase
MDEALMLDIHGFVSETNSTNVFFVKHGELLTPHADACLPGITRKEVIDIARSEGVTVHERNISISEVYSSDEMFCTGTVGELTPVLAVDGRIIGSGKPGPMTGRLREIYRQRTAAEGEVLPF